MALSENYRTETIGRSNCRPIVRLSADMIVRWGYRPNPIRYITQLKIAPLKKVSDTSLPSGSHISTKKNTPTCSVFSDVKSAFTSKINDVRRLLILKFVTLMTICTQ